MSTDVLYSSYEAFADARRERRRMSREAMGKFLASVGPEPARRVNAVIGEHLADVTNAYGGTARQPAPIIKARGHGYALGSLSVAREAFCKATGLSAATGGAILTNPAMPVQGSCDHLRIECAGFEL